MHESIVLCSTCTMSSYRKITFAISSPDEFLVTQVLRLRRYERRYSENRRFRSNAVTSKISGTRGRSPPIIFCTVS